MQIRVTVQKKESVYEQGVTFLTIAKEWQKEYEDTIILALFDHKLMELGREVPGDGEITFLTTQDKNGRRAYRRSVVFLMQRALQSLCPEALLRVEHSLGAGYYCRIVGKDAIDEAWLKNLQEQMQALVAQDLPICKKTIRTEDARVLFAERGMQDKERLMHYRSSSNCNIYELDGCIDYFYGYMAPSTGMLSHFALYPYEQGFILQFPQKTTTEVAPFEPATKLFHILQASEQWGTDMGIPSVGALNDAICAGKTREIILSQEAYMERRVGALAERIVADPNKKFVMIAGPSSSGKTTFSHRLSAQLRALGVTPHPIPLDD